MVRLAPAAAGARTPAPAVDSLLAQITAGLSDGRELESLLTQFLEPIMRLAGAQAGAVRVLSDDGEHLRLVGELGLPESVRQGEALVQRHCGTCGQAADGEALSWATDLQACARHHPQDAPFYLRCQRLLAVPLRHRGRVLGLYNLFFENAAEPAAEVQTVLRAVGELLGLALHNARLERETLRSTLDTERKFLASEVHDSIAQSLAYVHMRLPLLHDAMQAHDDALARKYFADVEQALGHIQCNLREILTNFRIGMDARGLLPALQGLAQACGQRAGIAVHLHADAHELGLSVEQEVQIFHIIQEALANVCRHAQARQAWVTLRHGGTHLDVRVEDDGRGLAALPAGGSAHFGLDIMHERAQRLGGAVEIGARCGGGTRVRLTVPLAAAASAIA